ncbi:MAG: amidohydrolase family protein [Verrucomicrobiota bacterium]
MVVTLAALIFIVPLLGKAETILLKNAIVHTVSSEPLTNGSVLIQDGKIVQVIDNTSPTRVLLPDNAKEIDLKGLHLYPGLIALDTALGLSEISGVRSTRDNAEVGDYTPEVESWIAVNPDSELLPIARANGITHIEPAPQGGIVAGQSGLVALTGWTAEEMAIQKPAALHVYWPGMELDVRPKEKFKDKTKWKSLEDQTKERREKLQALEDFFDEARAYDKAVSVSATNHAPEKVPAWEAMRLFMRGEKPIFVHADDIRQIKAALDWSKKTKFKIILAGARDAALVVKEIAAQNVPVIYEHVFTQPTRDTESYDIYFHAPEILRTNGVLLALGMGATTFDAALVKNLPYTVAQAMAFGLPEADALRSITLIPAQLLGVTNRLGSIEVGKEATLFACDGNIFDIRSNVKRLWIAGKEIGLETRHTRLYEKYRNRPKTK